jgi:drug/metabolite transporter (DMT)-like permease
MPITPRELMKLSRVGMLLWFVVFTVLGCLISNFVFNNPPTPLAILGAMLVPFSIVVYSEYKINGSVKLTED